jgi:hypothetical protein
MAKPPTFRPNTSTIIIINKVMKRVSSYTPQANNPTIRRRLQRLTPGRQGVRSKKALPVAFVEGFLVGLLEAFNQPN